MKPDETTPNKIGQFLREPVATLPACLCGLDTNPVTSPRMDVHCPKHDVPEAGGEPELPHEVTIVGCPHQPLSLWPLTCVVQHVNNQLQVATYTRVSQPAGSFRFLTRDDAERFIKHYLHSAQWEGERLIISFEREALIEALVEGDALAEARRAGTPTTDARAEAEAIVNEHIRLYGGVVLADNLRDAIESALSSTPGDKVAQRARAMALNEAANLMQTTSWLAEIPVKDDEQRLAKLFQKAADAIRALKHFTTDVERTCTWTCEPNPDIEMWETDCNNAFQFEVGGPSENKMKFCCYCGKLLAEATKKSEASNVR